MYGSRVLPALDRIENDFCLKLNKDEVKWIGNHMALNLRYLNLDDEGYKSKLNREFRKVPLSLGDSEVREKHARSTIAALSLSKEGPSARFELKSPGSTQNAHEKWIRNFWVFLCMIGDYESMPILSMRAPEGTPSVSTKSVCFAQV
jgi:hypothetical protein